MYLNEIGRVSLVKCGNSIMHHIAFPYAFFELLLPNDSVSVLLNAIVIIDGSYLTYLTASNNTTPISLNMACINGSYWVPRKIGYEDIYTFAYKNNLFEDIFVLFIYNFHCH